MSKIEVNKYADYKPSAYDQQSRIYVVPSDNK